MTIQSTKETPAQFRRAAKIAIAKAVLAQITALNLTLAQALSIGCDIRLVLHESPITYLELDNVMDIHGDRANSIYHAVLE